MWHGENLSHSIESFFERLNILQVLIFFFIGLVFLRVGFLQIIEGNKYRKISDENRIVIYSQPATRGKILDRNLDVIVDNKPAFTTLFSRQTLSDEEVQNVIQKVSQYLALPADDILKKIKTIPGNFSLIKIVQNIPKYQALKLAEKIPQLPGIVVMVEPIRIYRWGSVASHITGYIQEATQDELNAYPNLKPGDFIGRDGVEKQYDEIIRGSDGGSQVEVNARGIQKRILETVEPTDGNSIVLTIDKKVQNALSKNMDEFNGVAVAIHINTGEILGLCSSPDYNPNLFISGVKSWQLPYLLESRGGREGRSGSGGMGGKPLWNRALQGQYPPGSVYKMVTALAGLETGVITPQTIINCKGFIELGKYKQKFRCWAREGHGNMRLTTAIAESCDVFFYETALKLGPARLNEFAKKFGFGKKTEIDMPSEAKGLVPDRSWKKTRLHQDWYDGDTVNISVGQGYIWTTPIQIAAFIATIANEGTLFKPYILKKIIAPQGNVIFENKPQISQKLDINPVNFKLVKRGMLEAVQYGTGKNAKAVGLAVAGKTGTAQNPQGLDHAWFACFAPYQKPEIALVVMIEHGGGGGEVAAPVARKMLEEIFE
ncbi:MAG: penicillin-binding protein 2 [Elusimicrobiota bacterium]